jgi:hypothetical protein
MFYDDGNYCGCFYPIFEVFPNLQKYPLPVKNPEENWDYGMELINKHAFEIQEKDIKTGDVLVTKFKNELHIALILDKFKIIHVFRDHTLQISKINMFKSRLCKYFRVKN